MKTLRLICTWQCENDCSGCCNKHEQFSPGKIDCYKDFKEPFDQILITGGEPMLYIKKMVKLIKMLRIHQREAQIILYTAQISSLVDAIGILHIIDGMTLTLHEEADKYEFLLFQQAIRYSSFLTSKSLRLNVFAPIKVSKAQSIHWSVKKNIKWIPDCPLPYNEVIKQLEKPWK